VSKLQIIKQFGTKLPPVRGGGGCAWSFCLLGQNAFERAFMSVYVVCNFLRILFAIVLSAAQLCNNTPKQLKKVIFPGVLAFLSTHLKHSSVCCPAFLTHVPNENRLHPRVSTFSMT